MRETLRKLRGWNRWSHSVVDYYPVYPRPRWGHGAPSHPQITAVLNGCRREIDSSLGSVGAHRSELFKVPFVRTAERATTPFWNNPWFSTLDAAALMAFLWERKPRRYFEIGSGFSTMFARHAIATAGLPTSITSMDPRPRAEIDAICDVSIRTGLENCDLAAFEELNSGDILFYDGSHRCFTNSDVTTFFLEVLPRLNPGVLIHVHDIFLPDDYPEAWSKRLYSEQYLLAAMMLSESPPFKIILPCYFASIDPEFSVKISGIFKGDQAGFDIPTRYSNAGATPPTSFWLEKLGGNPYN